MLQRFVGGASLISLAYLNKQQKEAEAIDTSNKRAKLISASSYNAHFKKRFKNGEDAHLIDKGGRMICVFDGVGSWSSKYGIDVGAMTKELVGHIETVYNSWHLDDRRRSLHQILD